MTDTETQAARADIDILEDIQLWMNSYPPLVNDRRHVDIHVEDGVVHLSGHIKTPITRTVLRSRLRDIDGVTSVDDSKLYDDESIRFAVGEVVPLGVVANIEYGTVVLSGKLPSESKLEALTKRVAKVAGVDRIVPVKS